MFTKFKFLFSIRPFGRVKFFSLRQRTVDAVLELYSLWLQKIFHLREQWYSPQISRYPSYLIYLWWLVLQGFKHADLWYQILCSCFQENLLILFSLWLCLKAILALISVHQYTMSLKVIHPEPYYSHDISHQQVSSTHVSTCTVQSLIWNYFLDNNRP